MIAFYWLNLILGTILGCLILFYGKKFLFFMVFGFFAIAWTQGLWPIIFLRHRPDWIGFWIIAQAPLTLALVYALYVLLKGRKHSG